MRRRNALIPLLLTVTLFASGATEPLRLTSYHLGATDGLANNSVYCIEQDHYGFMWFGTFGGLSRYDGETFVNYRPSPGSGQSLAASVVFDLLEDSRGVLWVATDGGGLSFYDENGDTFTTIRAQPGGLASDRVLALEEDSTGRIWAGTGDGSLNVIDSSGSIKVIKVAAPGAENAAVRCIVAGPGGEIWAGTEGGGLYRLDPEGQINARFSAAGEGKGNGRLGDDVIRSLLLDSKGRLWVGLGNGGVDLLYSGSGDFVHAIPEGEGPRDAVRTLGEDPSGAIWIGYADSGIGHLQPEGMRFSPPSTGTAAGNPLSVRAIKRDRNGLMWVGFKEGGTAIYNSRSALVDRFLARSDGKPLSGMRGLSCSAGGRLFAVGDGQGLLEFDSVRGEWFPYPGYPTDRMSMKAYSVHIDGSGRIWVGTDGAGLVRMEGTRATRFSHDPANPLSLASNIVWALYEDPDGTMWIGTEGGGLDRYDPASGGFVHHRPGGDGSSSIRGASVRAIFRDSESRLWVGTWDGGLSVMASDTSGFRHYFPGSSTENSPAGLGDSSVNCIFEDEEGSIWVGTGGTGLAKLDPSGERFVHYGEKDGLAGTTVYGIVGDADGNLWISTATGLSRMDRSSGAFFNFGASDGLASDELSQNAFLRAADGRLWFGGPLGLSVFDPRRLVFEDLPPEVVITGLTVLGEGGRPTSSVSALRPKRIDLPFDNIGFRYSVAVLDYIAPERNRYAVTLEGGQGGWSELSHGNSGYMSRLNPGAYVLSAKAANGNGVWNIAGETLDVVVHPPFWGTWWFLSAAFLLIVMGAWLAVRMRINNLRKRNELLVKLSRHVESAREEERIAAARDVHDEIGQHLAALNLQAWWLDSHSKAPLPQRRERISEMIGSIGEAMSAVKRVANNLRPVALDALSFHEALAWYVEAFGRRSGIETSLDVVHPFPEISGKAATALFRITQELLTNVWRHSGAAHVAVHLAVEDDQLALAIRDDGKGIEPGRAEADDSFGIIGIRERCAMFGGRFMIAAVEGGGTLAEARLPQSRLQEE